MRDLIYCEDIAIRKEVERIILEKYPKVIINDASDDIHRERIELIFDNNEEYLTDEYIKFMIEEGLVLSSLGIRFLLHDSSEKKRIKRLIDEST